VDRGLGAYFADDGEATYSPKSPGFGQYGSNLPSTGWVNSDLQISRGRSSRAGVRGDAIRDPVDEESTKRPVVSARPQKVTSIPSFPTGDDGIGSLAGLRLRLFLMDGSTFSSRSELTGS
jgi:hypothetical protein